MTADDADRRLARDGPNELPAPRRPSLVRRTLRELTQPLVALLLVAAAVSGLVLHEQLDAAAIAAIVVLNAAIGLVEEGRANQALDALRELEAPMARVRRDGRIQDLPTRALVRGDVMLVATGERVPADAALVTAEGLEVDEAVLTGESLPVTKQATPACHTNDGEDRLFAGTSVTRGRGTARVTATGPSTAMGRLATSLRDERPPTPLQRELAGVARLLGVAAVVVAALVLVLLVVRLGGSASADDLFLTAVAVAVAAVPEGLATVTAVALALGVRAMADHGAIVRRLPAVETLGATTVLVFDKTGTLTENRLRLDAVVWSEGTTAAGGGDDRRPAGTTEPLDLLPDPVRARVEMVAALCNDSEPGTASSGDPVEQSLVDAVGVTAVQAIQQAWPRVDAVPFSSEQGWMGTGHRASDGEELVVVKGAPEVVGARCHSQIDATGDEIALDDVRRAALARTTDDVAATGAKVLALAFAGGTHSVAMSWDEGRLVLVGLVALRDPLRPASAATVDAAQRAGISLIIATGDHPGTATAVARDVGLTDAASPDGRTGDQVADHGWPADPAAVPVYARVRPEQKLELVDALQSRGEVVAMTGDGVNDAPALQAADIGVALGRQGTDVAREAADLVVIDDDLATMVEAVRRGRLIYRAIQRVVDYLVAANLSEIALVVAVLLIHPDLGVPLLPLQLLWINLVTDGAPAVALGLADADDGVLHRPPRPRDQQLLDRRRWARLSGRGALLASAAFAATTLGRGPLDLDAGQVRTLTVSVLVVSQLLYAATLAPWRLRSTLTLAVGAGGALHAAALLLPAGRLTLDLSALPAFAWPIGLALGVAPVAVLAALHRRRTQASGGSA